jgi:large subunit ribosomal protein L21
MYAIIRTGGKQYRVQVGDVVRVEKLQAEPGSELHLTDVLAVGGEHPLIGDPNVKNAKVTVVVTRQAKAPKLIVFKKKRRQGYRKMQGHRQLYTEVFVKAIHTAEGKVEADTEAKVFNPEAKQVRVEQLQEWRDKQRKAADKEEVAAAPVTTPKKKAAKKVAKKASPAKKVRKKTVKKTATAAKTTKKKSSK